MTSRDREAPLYFDDLKLGMRALTGTYTMKAEEIIAFAKEWDPQPFHVDPDAAKKTIFGGLVASGWHTAAITMRLIVQSGLPVAGGSVGAGVEVNWPQPTRPGDVLHVESEVIDLKPSRSKPDRGIVTVRSETKNHRGEVVQVTIAKMIVPRRVHPIPNH